VGPRLTVLAVPASPAISPTMWWIHYLDAIWPLAKVRAELGSAWEGRRGMEPMGLKELKNAADHDIKCLAASTVFPASEWKSACSELVTSMVSTIRSLSQRGTWWRATTSRNRSMSARPWLTPSRRAP
jgi:hypothetical protein